MESKGDIFNDNQFSLEFNEKSFKIHKLVRNGLQNTFDVSLSDVKFGEDLFHGLPDLKEVNKRAQEADRCFGEVMVQTMENNQLPQYLHQLLQEQKSQAETILKDYDSIIFQLNAILSTDDKKYRKKVEEQSNQHQIIRQRIEEVIKEINRVGKEEIASMRAAIVDHSKSVSQSLWTKNGTIQEEIKDLGSGNLDKSFCILTAQEIEDSFLVNQNDTFQLRKNLLSEICKLRNELERKKLNYNLNKQVFEQEIFFLSEKYSSGLLALSKTRRQCNQFRCLKNSLLQELKQVNSLIKKETKDILKQKSRVNQLELEQRYSREEQPLQHLKIFEERKSDAYQLYSQIMNLNEFLFENILNMHWKPLNKSPSILQLQQDWGGFLNTSLDDLTIDTILKLMEEHWLETRTCVKLTKLQECLILQSETNNSLLKLYNKYQ